MRRAFNSNDRGHESLDATRRLYRVATDLAKRLDEQKSCALTAIDIFTPSGEILRGKLKDYCERLILKDPVTHARKIEELLWRRGFYDVVAAAKKLRKGNVWSDTEKALLSTHLCVGIGFYHHLILKLQQECGPDISGILDFAFPNPKNAMMMREKNTQKLHSQESRQCAMKIIHRSLICLGDLTRYKLDLDPNWDPMIAIRYYKMAITIDPNIGMPHNQLGTLAGNRNFGIDAVYHYLRCTLCLEPFEGTEGNLKRVISNNIFYAKEKLPTQRCAARLFTLLQKWDDNTLSVDRINEDCENLLTEIESCLTLNPPISTPLPPKDASIDDYLKSMKIDHSPHLTDALVFKMVSICLMFLSKLQSHHSPHTQSISAFILSLLSKLLEITILKIQTSLLSVCSPKTSLNSDLTFLAETQLDKFDPKYSTNAQHSPRKLSKMTKQKNRLKNKKDKSKYLLRKLRRPRRRFNSSDSEATDIEAQEIDSSTDDQNSEDSETRFSDLSQEQLFDDVSDDDRETTILSSGIGAPNVKGQIGEDCENAEINDQKFVAVSDNIDNGDATILDLVFLAQKQNLRTKDVLSVICKTELLDSIKVCFDWIRSHSEMINVILRSKILVNRILSLVNLLVIDFREILEDSALGEGGRLEGLVQCVPMPEDQELKGLDVLKEAHVNLNWKILRNFEITKREQVILRTRKLVNFGDFLVGIKAAGIDFDGERRMYSYKNPEDTGNEGSCIKQNGEEKVRKEKSNGKEKEQKNGDESDHSKGKLMRHMGKLWLKAEVRALETRLRSKLMSAYLVPDHEALAKHMPVLKKLMYAKKFIIVIPSVVVSALDEVKRTSGQAREATRWLETQLRKGSRFLRAQRAHENLALPYIKGPRPKDKEAWAFFQIIECCHYLTQQSNAGLSADTGPPVVTLLTGTKAEEKKSSSFNSDGLAKTAGINLEHIEAFHTKWKTSSKSHG